MYIASNDYFLRILRILSLPGGIIVQPEYEKLRIPYVISFIVLLCGGIVVIVGALFIPDASRIQIMETIQVLSSAFNILTLFVIQQLLRDRLIDLYMDIQRQYHGDVNFIKLCDTMSSHMMRKGLQLVLWLYIAVNTPPILLILVTDAKMGEIRTLIFPIWCPWPIDTTWKYLLIMGVQILITWVVTFLFFGSLGMILCYIITIRSKCEILEADITKCFQSNENERRFGEVFRSIIMKHQDLMR